MLDGLNCTSDEIRRQLYVAMTRAKENLYIHENSSCLWCISASGTVKAEDYKQYGEASGIILQLHHRDIWLDSCLSCQAAIGRLISGDPLYVSGYAVKDRKGSKVVAFSKSFIQKYESLLSKGYRMAGAKVNFVLYWKPEDREEMKIVLPELYLEKNTLS